ncbi:hypothetical protein NDU88_005906 [Pleurodeles waltl]|uniref:Uncharacterized protein n=1 Tax=Pleurodeles waltl TaxID=8319 RepID=A0AAV7MAQ9_PLEWA|nr:hypothetical protein NDU88_005906 [Pleurodeles waltl]
MRAAAKEPPAEAQAGRSYLQRGQDPHESVGALQQRPKNRHRRPGRPPPQYQGPSAKSPPTSSPSHAFPGSRRGSTNHKEIAQPYVLKGSKQIDLENKRETMLKERICKELTEAKM